MAQETVEYLTQSFDFFGSLARNLQDLQGFDTLVYELIQNADDVKDENGKPAAFRITFDIHDDALIVENDGVFREVDFNRMQSLAGGGKRDEPDTTGAFGIGFTAVYQITDNPELFSNRRHWRFVPRPEDNIETRHVEETSGTVFRLPYATDPNSEIRQKLKLQAFDLSKLDELEKAISDAIFFASLFLKQLTTLEVKRSGQLVRCISRMMDGNKVLLTEDNETTLWYLLQGKFEEAAEKLRLEYPNLLSTKHGRVDLAIPDKVLESGRLFAVLPTNTITGLPFHINADFFPKSDRKQIIFENDYRSDWNRIAIRTTTQIIIDNFEGLKQHFGHREIWQFLQQIKNCATKAQNGEIDEVFVEVWKDIKRFVAEDEIVFSSSGRWLQPKTIKLIPNQEAQAADFIFDGIGITVVNEDLRDFYNLLREIGVHALNIVHIAEALHKNENSLDKSCRLEEAPPPLNEKHVWPTFWAALDAILKQSRQPSIDKDRLRICSIFLTEDNWLLLANDVSIGDDITRELFWWVNWMTASDITAFPTKLVEQFTVHDAVLALEKRNDLVALWEKGELDLPRLFHWFQNRHKDFKKYQNQKLKQRFRNLAIFPVAGTLRPLTDNLYIPGGFKDPLGETNLIDVEAVGDDAAGFLVQEFDIEQLDYETYITDVLPRHFSPNIVLSSQQINQLVVWLVSQFDALRQSPRKVRSALRELRLIELDKENYFARGKGTYLNHEIRAILGEDAPVAKPVESQEVMRLYKWLGADTKPRTDDIIKRLRQVSQWPANQRGKALEIVKECFNILAQADDSFQELQEFAWLPGKRRGEPILDRWFRAEDVYSHYCSYIFDQSDAIFLDINGPDSKFLQDLHVKSQPTVELVIQHLIRSMQLKKPVNMEVYAFLNSYLRKRPYERQWLDDLKQKRCILLNEIYVSPQFVFTGEHPFGRLRSTLGSEWKDYHTLVEALGVKEKPDFQDYRGVMLEIADSCSDSSIDNESYDIMMNCWQDLARLLLDDNVNSHELFRAFSNARVIPNQIRNLQKPTNILFEDRPDIAPKIDPRIRANILRKDDIGVWRAMQSAGVRQLSNALQAHAVELTDPRPDERRLQRIVDRRRVIKRVLDSENELDNRERISRFFDHLSIKQVDELVVEYRLDILDGVKAPAKHITALYQSNTIYFTQANDSVDIARELAFALYPDGNITALIDTILNAESISKANEMLTRLGVPESRIELGIDSDDLVEQDSDHTDTPEITESTDTSPIVSTNELDPLDEGISSDSSEKMTLEQEDDTVASATTHLSGSERFDKVEETLQGKLDALQRPKSDTPREGLRRTNNPKNSQKDQKQTTNNKSKKKRRPSSKLRSYVTPEPDNEGDTDPIEKEKAAKRTEVDEAGIRHVMQLEKEQGRLPKEMPHHNVGFDVISSEPDGNTRYIEVKSLSGYWGTTGAGLSKAQYNEARKRGNSFWLYVVENALDSSPNIYQIQNPAERIDQYLFDDGWQDVSVQNRVKE